MIIVLKVISCVILWEPRLYVFCVVCTGKILPLKTFRGIELGDMVQYNVSHTLGTL